jgi:hypothetical protein
MDLIEYFSDIENDAISRKAVVLQVWIDRAKPRAGEAGEAPRKIGYFFGGVLPRWFDGDGVLIQKLLCPPYF